METGTLHGTRARLWRTMWIAAIAAVYVAYLGLLITCDVLSVPFAGFIPKFKNSRVTVSSLLTQSPAARAGIEEGDRIVRANGQLLAGPPDWQRVVIHVDPSRPLTLDLERHDRPLTVAVPIPLDLAGPRLGGQRGGVLAFRFVQIVTLTFAIVVAFRRSFRTSALLGSVMLAATSTVTLSLPMQLATFWGALPAWLQLLLWIPYTTSAAVGPLLFAFCAVFPQRIWSRTRIGLALAPAVTLAAFHLYAGIVLMRDSGPPTHLPDGVPVVFFVNAIYALLAIGLLITHRRAAQTLTDGRRISVLIAGTALGAVAGLGVIGGYWRNPGAGVFASPWMTVLSLVVLAMPASFAYAILRHRLFDVRLIVRQGLRYALARRFVNALIPILGALLLWDIIQHRDQPIGSLLQRRWWSYVPLAATLLVVRSWRETWLRNLDRRFFRERYDAQRLLTSIAEQVARASSFETIAPTIVRHIDQALHPEFVAVMRHVAAQSAFSSDTGAVSSSAHLNLPVSLTVIRLLEVLRKPLAVSRDTEWMRHHLPLDERTLLLEREIELLVPISPGSGRELPLGLLALGPRRSEEPYNQEDMDLLSTIADAIGVLLQRTVADERGLAECERCGACFDGSGVVCAHDGQPLAKMPGTLVINDRYRLERRLGRGGMGTVYLAMDGLLERRVALKVIREGFAGPLDLPARFRREARTAAAFAHPNVVRVHDFGVDPGGRPFLVMEYLEGSTLRERLVSAAPLDRSEALHVLRGICSALEAAHSRGLVHRDLKPENILLQQNPTGTVPKILDFGLAKALPATFSETALTTMATSAGVLVGTREYMAPEQLAGGDVSLGWDVWALGVIAYEMLTGVRPFRRISPVGPGHSTSAAPQLSPEMTAFFERALSPKVELRYQDAGEFLAAFERALA